MENLSILFAIEAEEMFNNGDFSSAIDLCIKGKEQFPDYPIGYIILAQSFNEISEFENAQLIITEAQSKFPTNRLIKRLFEDFTKTDLSDLMRNVDAVSETEPPADNEIESSDIIPVLEDSVISIDENYLSDEKIVEHELLIESISETEFDAESDFIDTETESEEIFENEEYESEDTNDVGIIEGEPKPDQENFLRLVVSYDTGDMSINSLKSANPALIPGLNYTPLRARSRQSNERSDKHIPIFPDFSMHFDEELLRLRENDINDFMDEYDDTEESGGNTPMIVSDTYASILVAQGAYSEALETYRELCSKNPDKSEFYNQKIDELQLMI